MPKPINGTCAFCLTESELRDSHVLPAFVFRWLRRRSVTGHIRNTDAPNRRVQDGLKVPMLCGTCEAQFSKYETAFATKLFHPWHDGIAKVAYSDWLLKFAVSVSWRVLRFARGRNPGTRYTDEQNHLMDEAAKRWKAFLTGVAPHPGPFEQHMLIFDVIEDTTLPSLPQNINRFLTGAVTLDIVGSQRSLMTFAKMGRFIIFGMIQKGPNKWEGTKIHVKGGVIRPGKFLVPAGLLDLIEEKARLHEMGLAAMSPAQRAKVRQMVQMDPDRLARSEQFRAMVADARMFGIEAILDDE